jgi:hypothetical protein
MSDSDWQVRCSTSGYAFFVANAVVAYLSKKQPTIAMSSAQAEIYAASLVGLEATFMIGFLHQLTEHDVAPVEISVDSKAAKDLSQDFVSNQRTRHFERRQLKVRELVERALVQRSSPSAPPITCPTSLPSCWPSPCSRSTGGCS